MARAGVQYATTSDGVGIAYLKQGSGPPVVVAAGLNTTIEMELATEEFGRSFVGFWTRLADEFTVIRYDMRGFGLSQRNVATVSVETMVADLKAVADAAGAGPVSLIGVSHGSQATIKYAAEHPGRVARLALLGAFVSLRERERATARAMAELYQANWGIASDAMLRLWRRMPGHPQAEREVFAQGESEDFALRQRKTADREAVTQLLRSNAERDLSGYLPGIRVPTMVVHGQDDRLVPFHHGREIAAAIPGAELVPFRGDHAGWCVGAEGDRCFLRLARFLGGSAVARAAAAPLSTREQEVLALVAAGRSNADVAARLSLSVRTVERHCQNIYTKLGVHNRVEAAYWAREHGLI